MEHYIFYLYWNIQEISTAANYSSNAKFMLNIKLFIFRVFPELSHNIRAIILLQRCTLTHTHTHAHTQRSRQAGRRAAAERDTRRKPEVKRKFCECTSVQWVVWRMVVVNDGGVRWKVGFTFGYSHGYFVCGQVLSSIIHTQRALQEANAKNISLRIYFAIYSDSSRQSG